MRDAAYCYTIDSKSLKPENKAYVNLVRPRNRFPIDVHQIRCSVGCSCSDEALQKRIKQCPLQ